MSNYQISGSSISPYKLYTRSIMTDIHINKTLEILNYNKIDKLHTVADIVKSIKEVIIANKLSKEAAALYVRRAVENGNEVEMQINIYYRKIKVER